jgi:hypothetical protein
MGDDADAATRARSGALTRLSRTVVSDAGRLSHARGVGLRKLERQVRAASAKLDRRIESELVPLRGDIEKVGARHAALLRQVRRRAVWDDLVVLSALPLLAAFGQPDDPLASNNLVLVASLLVWLLGDELTDLISGSGAVFGIRDTDIWSYVAPYANLLTGWFLLRNAQNVRFITGPASDFQPFGPFGRPLLRASAGEVKAAVEEPGPGQGERVFTFRREIDLMPFIAPDHRDSFLGFEKVPAVASIARITWGPGLEDPATRRVAGLTAVVEDGALILTVTVAVSSPKPPGPDAVLSELSAAWIVDTAQPKA